MSSQIVFNLVPFQELLFLPSAYIVELDAQNRLGYPLQRATLVTIGPHGHSLTPALQRLLDLTETLSAKALEARFKPPKAKMPTQLAQLLTDAATKAVVEKFIFDKLDLFLQELHRDGWALTFDLERKTRADDVLIHFPEEDLVPHISFSKTDEGVEYRFQLGNEQEKWPIQSRPVIPLTNTDPAWILVENRLYRVAGINGNMVKPFRNKDVVHIPPDKAKLYFRQFVAKNAGRTRIEANGFEVRSTNTLLKTILRPTENVLENNWYLQAVFQYPEITFSHGERRDRFTAVDFSDDAQEEILVRQVSRNPAEENKAVALLTGMSLQLVGKLFQPGDETSLESLIEWMANHQEALGAAGFELERPNWQGHSLELIHPHLRIACSAQGDWFDVHGTIEAGAFQLPFKAFWQHLRKKERLFRLPDGTYFLIPEAWFARYADLADAAKEGPEEALRLPKSLYTVLQGAGLVDEQSAVELQIIDPETVDYQVSEDLKADLRPYQLQGVKWLVGHYHAGFGACLADDMGLGKTLQTIALLLHAKAGRQEKTEASGAQLDLFQAYRSELNPLNALIILPASLVFNWHRELTKFAPSLFVCAHTGPKRSTDARALSGYDVVLTTYHTARQDLELLGKMHWHVIVLDESQQIKNRSSELSKVVLSLNADCKVSLSGTPIENSLADLWSQMEFINPATLGTFNEFREKFIQPIEKHNDERAKQRLFQRVRPFFLRRTKEEVAPDLPPLTEQLFYSEMSAAQAKMYEQTKSAARNEILALFDDPKTRFQALVALTRLRQIANDPRLVSPDYTGGSGKFDDVLAQWDTIRRSGHKVLFFSSFERHLQLFREVFNAEGHAYAWLTGDTSVPKRALEVKRFQESPEVQAFFMTVKAGGVGLNLTAADYVFMLDPWWNPAIEDQAIARAHRIGRQFPVTALRFLSRDTIEEKIRQLQEKKKLLGKALFGDEEASAITREEMELLLA